MEYTISRGPAKPPHFYRDVLFACLIVVAFDPFSNAADAADDATKHRESPRPCGIAFSETSMDAAGIRLYADGVGDITAQTPARAAALSAALPGLWIEEGTGYTENSPYPMFHACRGDETILTIVPGDGERIHSIVVKSAQIRNDLGPAVGSRFEDVIAPEDYAQCTPGEEELAGMLLCPQPSATNVTYVFSGAWNGPDGELPPRRSVRDWTLTGISWSPPSGD